MLCLHRVPRAAADVVHAWRVGQSAHAVGHEHVLAAEVVARVDHEQQAGPALSTGGACAACMWWRQEMSVLDTAAAGLYVDSEPADTGAANMVLKRSFGP